MPNAKKNLKVAKDVISPTSVDLVEVLVILQRLVVQPQVDVDGAMGRLLVELVRPQDVLEPQEVDVRPEGHLPQAVGVKVELVFDDFTEMLDKEENNLKQRTFWSIATNST